MKSKVAKSFQKGGGFTHFLSLPLALVSGVGDVYRDWRDQVIARQYPGLLPRLLIGPQLLHITLCMLPLSEAGYVERARGAVKACEDEIKTVIAERGINGRLMIEFDRVEIFGTPEETRVVYMKLKEDTD